MQADVGIIGGGASGIAAAIAAGRGGERVLLLESMEQIGKKLLATGNGRCNLINSGKPVYYGDPEFAALVTGSNPVDELTAFWHSLGLFLRYDREGRGYPFTGMASTVVEVLKAEMKRLPVEICTKAAVTGIRKDNHGFLIQTQKGEMIPVKRLILATGGAAQPKLGGNQNAWSWLQSLGHRMIPARPSLVPLRTDSKSISGLAGLRVRGQVRLEADDRTLHAETGEVLFTEHGVSGICVMQCSRFYSEADDIRLRINMMDGLLASRKELEQELKRRMNMMPDEEPLDLLRGLCAAKMGYAVCKQAGLPLRGEKNRYMTGEQIGRLSDCLMGYTVHVTGTDGFEKAQVMAGGAACGEFDPRNMESRKCAGLHVTGELLNVDGDCGGFNLMFAFLSGIRAGENGRQRV